MPGVVHVVVLEFKGVSSSSKNSAKSLKVSMGKRQYEIWDRGEISFPVTRLREDLVISLMDASGNEIAHSGIRTLEIIEKGCWDEVFSINGSGHVHMKLQFVLSEEEKNRIRVMRESALKRKNAMDLSINGRLVDTTSSTLASLPISVNNDQKGADSQKKFFQLNVARSTPEASEATPSINLVASSAFSIPSQQLEERINAESAIQDAEPLLDTSHRSRSALTSHDIHGVKRDFPEGHHRLSAKKFENQELHVKADPVVVDSRKDVPTKKPPSNVRKMVSAFEDTRFQDAVLMNSEREVKIPKTSSSVSSQSRKEQPSAFGMAGIETTQKEQEEKTANMLRESTGTTAMRSDGTITEQCQVAETHNISPEIVPHGPPASESERRETSLDSTTAILVQDAPIVKPRSTKSYTKECCSTQSSGMCIFPDNTRLVSIDHRKFSFPQPERHHKDERRSADDMTETTSGIAGDVPKLGSGSPGDGPNGLLRQVIKIAVILGFGVIILLTREKEPRKRSTKGKGDHHFVTSDQRED